MNTLRQMCAAVILTMALAVSALAGDIYCPTATAPAPSGQIESPTAMSTEPGETNTPPSLTTTLILALLSVIS